MKRLTQCFILFLLSFLLFSSTSSPIYAQSTAGWYDLGYPENIENANTGSINAAAHVSNVNTNTYSDFIRRVLGPVPGLTITASAMNTPYAETMRKQSAIAGISNYIYAMYTSPPASTYAFIQDMGRTLGFIPKQAYAQGVGFSELTSLLPIWKAFRNISYGILAIVMVAIGFMVMFRKKIDPKTVVTVQNALPKIVITLLLITFSYAIVGFMIDLMYLLLIMGVQLIVTASPAGTFDQADRTFVDIMTGGNFGALMRSVMLGGLQSTKDLVNFLYPQLESANKFEFVVKYIFGFSWINYGASTILIGLILSIALLFGVVRLFFMLLSAYIQILLAVLTGPIQILLEAIPGGQGFSNWFKNLISNLVVFPLTAILITISQLLIKSSTHLWTPPFIGLTSGVLFEAGPVGLSANGIGGVIGLGMLFTIPSVIKGIQESLKAKPMINVGLGSAVAPVTAGVGQIFSLGSTVFSLSAAKAAKDRETEALNRLKNQKT